MHVNIPPENASQYVMRDGQTFVITHQSGLINYVGPNCSWWWPRPSVRHERDWLARLASPTAFTHRLNIACLPHNFVHLCIIEDTVTSGSLSALRQDRSSSSSCQPLWRGRFMCQLLATASILQCLRCSVLCNDRATQHLSWTRSLQSSI